MTSGHEELFRVRLADRIRHLAADAEAKLNGEGPQFGDDIPESCDRQYVLEDLIGHLLTMADTIDGRLSVSDMRAGPGDPAYPLIERPFFGDLVYDYPTGDRS